MRTSVCCTALALPLARIRGGSDGNSSHGHCVWSLLFKRQDDGSIGTVALGNCVGIVWLALAERNWMEALSSRSGGESIVGADVAQTHFIFETGNWGAAVIPV